MSRRKYQCNYQTPVMPNIMPSTRTNCCCNFPTLVILILIILQFSRKNVCYDYDDEDCEGEEVRHHDHGSVIDNGILFIIALFYLSCCNPCR